MDEKNLQISTDIIYADAIDWVFKNAPFENNVFRYTDEYYGEATFYKEPRYVSSNVTKRRIVFMIGDLKKKMIKKHTWISMLDTLPPYGETVMFYGYGEGQDFKGTGHLDDEENGDDDIGEFILYGLCADDIDKPSYISHWMIPSYPTQINYDDYQEMFKLKWGKNSFDKCLQHDYNPDENNR